MDMTPHALTREQEVARAFQRLREDPFRLGVVEIMGMIYDEWTNLSRIVLAQQAQEVERLKLELEASTEAYVKSARMRDELKSQLAAMRAERDEKAKALDAFEITLSETIAKLEASQARVRELERLRFTVAPSDVVDYLSKEVDQLLPMLGVEAAIVTDMSHVGDFPDERLGAEKYIWQAAIDLLRTQLATLQATLAEREATIDGLRAECRRVEVLHHAVSQDAARLREAAQNLTCAVCKMDMQRALKGA